MRNSDIAIKAKFRDQLESWHRSHGYELSVMVEEKPLLFRALLDKPNYFDGYELGMRFSRLVRSTVNRVEKSPAYRDAFLEPRAEVQPKDRLSIGRIIVQTGKKRKNS